MEPTQATPEFAPATPLAARDFPILMTPKAIEMIKHTRGQEGMDDQYGLRVAVQGGGCSGFQYALDFEREQRANDYAAVIEGLSVFVDPVSARYLKGTQIDYVLGMQGAGFKFHNPNAAGSCGCGSSFAV